MQNGLKSAGVMSRLSVTVWLPNVRRKYPTSRETRGTNSCCTLAEYSQLYGRFPQPWLKFGSYVVVMTDWPKFGLTRAAILAVGSRVQRIALGND